MAYDNYVIQIERVEKPGARLLLGASKLRFEITSSSSGSDPADANNNNDQTQERTSNSTCFEFLEEGLLSIRVAPVVDQIFNVHCVKSNSSGAEESVSVQVIHQRPGTFVDSMENLALVHLPTEKNVIVSNRPAMSTFQGVKKPGNSGSDDGSNSVTSMSDVTITEEDLRKYSKFIFKFSPVSQQNDEADVSASQSIASGELPANANTEASTPNQEEDKTVETSTETEDADADSTSQSTASDEKATVNFQAFFDNVISISMELLNLAMANHGVSEAKGSLNLRSRIGPPNDFYLQPQTATNSPLHTTCQTFRDLQNFERRKALQQSLNLSPSFERSHWHRTSNKILLLRQFVKTIVRQRLQALGIQHLDCNEIIDSWEAKRHSPFLPFLDEEGFDRSRQNPMMPELLSPFISKPNSALFQLSPSGHITKSIFSTFVHQVESLKGILNNATCNLIHTSVWLLLPEFKLLFGRLLDSNRNPVFIHEWIRLITLAAMELKPVSPEEVHKMITRELKSLQQLSKQLHKTIKKICSKIEALSQFSENIFRRTLAHLNPKSLKKLDAFDITLRKKYSPDVMHFEPDLLHKISIYPTDLFKDHIFFTESKKGELLIKNELDGCWNSFADLQFVDRRSIFLAMSEDLQGNMRTCLHSAEHLQEIYTAGYPGSIKNLLKDVVDELKFTAKQEDLTLLIKTSIVTHVSCLHEMLTRLLYIAEEVKGITKQFNECLQNTSFDLKKMKRVYKKMEKRSVDEFSDTDTSTLNPSGYQTLLLSGIASSHPQLAIPFSNASVDLSFKKTLD